MLSHEIADWLQQFFGELDDGDLVGTVADRLGGVLGQVLLLVLD